MRIAVVGCGYVSSFYAQTFPNYPQVQLVGATDRVDAYARAFCEKYGVRQYRDVAEILDDATIDAVVNLTNPDQHYAVSRAALGAGKHVYSEKPLATDLDQARELVQLAKQNGLQISSAPCNLLGESAQTMWKALRQNIVGQVRLVYAELDDGLIHKLGYQDWLNEFGRPWPYKDEFEVGCTLEHAGYYISWLVAFFGSAVRLTTFPSVLIPDKGTPVDRLTPDFSVACLEFESGVVARLTCSIVAPHAHQLRIFGDDGTLETEDCWYYDSPVHFEPFSTLSIRKRKIPFLARFKNAHSRRIPLVRNPSLQHSYRTGGHRMDFARGVAEMADAVSQGRDCRLSADFSLHVNEIVLKIQNPIGDNAAQTIHTRAGSIEPMPWAT